ncbi:MAG TPA: dihydrodipicolinate reductase C-terminal domain-containing protein [Pyrinomonadaceae bacterium]|jgi:4-hydroxy-tetrahydrodipicolinate reductase
MKLALIGYGAMNRLVGEQARGAGHEIAFVVSSKDAERAASDVAEQLRGHDAAIDFSVAGAVLRNVEACARASVPLVEGTTGWKADEASVRRAVEEHGGALVYGANFSIGVNIFYRIVAHAARLFQAVEAYEPFVEEAHHSRKRDAPSGTALHLRELLIEHGGATDISVASTRAGHVPGTHRVGFDAAPDQILLTHEARSREGFAAGALRAAEWMVKRRASGVYEFSEVMDEIFESGSQDNA